MKEFYDVKFFGVVLLYEMFGNVVDVQNMMVIIILVMFVVFMIVLQFFMQLQIIFKNLLFEVKIGQVYQMQKIMLYVLLFGFIFLGVFFLFGVVVYWFILNFWIMGQQFFVICEMLMLGFEVVKVCEECLVCKGKVIDLFGKVVLMVVYEVEQQCLFEEVEKVKVVVFKCQQFVGKKCVKKKGSGL